MIGTIKPGDNKKEVLKLCELLGYIPGKENYSEDLVEKVKSFQENNSLTVDGIVGPKTWLSLFIDNRMKVYKGVCEVNNFDYSWAGEYLVCEPECLMAVVDVETGGKNGFIESGKPQILFEGHIFWKELKERGINPEPLSKEYPNIVYQKWDKSKYYGGIKEYERFNLASRIDLDSAISSTSWGMFQILGNNYELCSCNSPQDLHNKMCKSQVWQFILGIEFIRNSGLSKYLEIKDWAKFAKGYNGPGYSQNKYDTKLKDAYNKHKSCK